MGKERKKSAGESGEQGPGRQRRLSSESRRTSESNIMPLSSPDASTADAPRGRLRSSTLGDISEGSKRPSSARPGTVHSAEKPKKKTIRPAPVARPISAQPSRALMRKAEERRLEEEKERERKEKEREREEREREREEREKEERKREERERKAQEEQEGLRKQASQTDGGDVKAIPSANGTPAHKKSLPVRS